jgi:hypothetical protein
MCAAGRLFLTGDWGGPPWTTIWSGSNGTDISRADGERYDRRKGWQRTFVFGPGLATIGSRTSATRRRRGRPGVLHLRLRQLRELDAVMRQEGDESCPIEMDADNTITLVGIDRACPRRGRLPLRLVGADLALNASGLTEVTRQPRGNAVAAGRTRLRIEDACRQGPSTARRRPPNGVTIKLGGLR